MIKVEGKYMGMFTSLLKKYEQRKFGKIAIFVFAFLILGISLILFRDKEINQLNFANQNL